MANTARQFAAEARAQGHESTVTNDLSALDATVDVVCLHGAWLPILWQAAKRAKKIGAKLVIRPAGSYDPVRLAYHGWKKRLVAFFEHRMLMRADVVLATCRAEEEWIRAYEPRVKKIEVTDLKRFFRLNHETHEIHESEEGKREKRGALHLLYLGRRHPLKGVEYLESAVAEIVSEGRSSGGECPKSSPVELRIVSNAFGEEKERVWEWCDVLVLPTLSENFGRVVAEALERGKRVITTDGAPAWGAGLRDCGIEGLRDCGIEGLRDCGIEGETGNKSDNQTIKKSLNGRILRGYGGRLYYLVGYREGSRNLRVQLLKRAIEIVRLWD